MPTQRSTPGLQLLQKGEELGFRWGQYTMLVRQLRSRFDSQVTHDIALGLRTASLERIALCAERVLSAGTLAEVLAD